MTETEWLDCDDPADLLNFFQRPAARPMGPDRPLLSPRKLRLFACACCRAVWHLLADERSRKAVDVAERFADGLATAEELRDALTAASRAGRVMTVTYLPVHACDDLTRRRWDGFMDRSDWPAGIKPALAALLRDIAGTPFQPVVLPPGPEEEAEIDCPDCEGAGELYGNYASDDGMERCRRCHGKQVVLGAVPGPCPWLTPDVLSLARAAYEERQDDGHLDPLRLAVLADALEEAGCQSTICVPCKGTGIVTVYGPEDWSPQVGTYRQSDEVACDKCSPAVEPWGDEPERGLGHVPHPLLAHLRSPGPHVRGCWALDRVRGKE